MKHPLPLAALLALAGCARDPYADITPAQRKAAADTMRPQIALPKDLPPMGKDPITMKLKVPPGGPKPGKDNLKGP